MEMPMEALYFPSQAQSNAYNLTFVKSSTPAENSFPAVLKYDLLVAYYRPVADSVTTKECFMLYRFSSDSHGVNTTVKSLDFVYLPGDCNIACINALQDSLTGEYIVGIGFVTNVTCDILNSPTFRYNLNTHTISLPQRCGCNGHLCCRAEGRSVCPLYRLRCAYLVFFLPKPCESTAISTPCPSVLRKRCCKKRDKCFRLLTFYYHWLTFSDDVF
ncbi:hypothetical protein PHET_11837 [Paragonimus heterotremus]|uniref:Uncharacterized protein n=1 Tax=Paragonimus heterotremus TaxID=100268 RepID=A0A8J4T3A6_9TREM|nr:hypothetical protein PHET_11837 [Paragonimus heterotremus]